MNRSLLMVILLTVASLLVSCDSTRTERHLSVAGVSNITYQAANGALLFKWDNPQIENLSYVEISYTNKKGKTLRSLVPAGETQTLVQGLADNDPYEFRFVVYNQLGDASLPIVYTAQADAPLVSIFDGRVKIVNAMGGIRVSWENDYEADFYIELSYKDLNGNSFAEEVIAAANTKNSQYVRIGSKIQGTQTLDINAKVSDANGNISGERVIKYYKMESGRLDRSLWMIGDLSSENSEGPATNTIDGDSKSFWHSRWSSNKPNYPHYIVYDLGAKKMIEKVSFQHRPAINMAKGIELYGTNKSATAEDSQWYMFGSVEMALGNDAEQQFELPSPVEYRFVKVKFVTPGNGDTMCAALAEFWIFGQDLEEE